MLKIKINEKIINNRVYNNINLELKSKVYILKGENGVGKTSFLNIIYGIDKNFNGSISFENKKEVINNQNSKWQEEICTYITQENNFINITVLDQINLSTNDYNYNKLLEYLKLFDFSNKLNQNVQKLSGGEIKKLQLIIALLKNTPIILMDEIENHLDQKTIKTLYQILENSNQLIILVTHQNNYINFDEIIMDNTAIKLNEKTNKDFLFTPDKFKKIYYPQNLKKAYKKNMFIYFFGTILITLLLFMVLNFDNNTNKDLKSFLKGNFDNNTTVIFPPVMQTNFMEQHEEGLFEKWNTKTPSLFTDNTIKQLEKLNYIQSITPIMPPQNNSYFSTVDIPALYSKPQDEVNLTIDLNKLNYNKYNFTKFKDTGNISASFFSTKTPAKQVNDVPPIFSNYENVQKILYGNIPNDNTNEILIDPYTAMYYADKLHLNSIQDLIDKEIKVPYLTNVQHKITGEVSGDNILKNFKVSGIYEPIKAKHEVKNSNNSNVNQAFTIYTAYSKDNLENITTDYNLSNKYYPQETFKALQNTVKTRYEEAHLKYDSSLLKENTKYYPGLEIKVKSSKDVETLTETINNYDKYIEINNNYVQQQMNKQLNNSKSNFLQYIIYLFYEILSLLLIFIFTIKIKKINNLMLFNGIVKEKRSYILGQMIKDHQKILYFTICFIILLNIIFSLCGFFYPLYLLLVFINLIITILILKKKGGSID